MWSGWDSGVAVRREGHPPGGSSRAKAGWQGCGSGTARVPGPRQPGRGSGLGGWEGQETGGGSSPRGFLDEGRVFEAVLCLPALPRPTPFVAGTVSSGPTRLSPRRPISTGLSRRRAGPIAYCCDS